MQEILLHSHPGPPNFPLHVTNCKSLILTSGATESELPAFQHTGKEGRKAQREFPFLQSNPFHGARPLAVPASDSSLLCNVATFPFTPICTHHSDSNVITEETRSASDSRSSTDSESLSEKVSMTLN